MQRKEDTRDTVGRRRLHVILAHRTYVRYDELDNHTPHGVKPDDHEAGDDEEHAATRACMQREGSTTHHSNAPGCSLCIFMTCLQESRVEILSYHLATCFLAVKSFLPLSEELTM